MILQHKYVKHVMLDKIVLVHEIDIDFFDSFIINMCC